MWRGIDEADITESPRRSRPDRGATFIELLVSIVLIGIGVIATTTALRTTVIASAIERDHARAQQWLQSAIGQIEALEFGDCSNTAPLNLTSGADIQAYYQTSGADAATVPAGWAGTLADVSVAVPEVWNGSSYVAFDCVLNDGARHQRVELTATSPDGTILEQVEVIKLDR